MCTDRDMAGTLLPWEEIKKETRCVKDQQIRQFIRLYREEGDRKNAPFKWGDEMEYMLIRLDHTHRKADLLLDNKRVVSIVNRCNDEPRVTGCHGENGSTWTTELAPYMVESSPGEPFGGELSDYISVEENLKFRREQINDVLNSQNGTEDVCLSMGSFPRLGYRESMIPCFDLTSQISTGNGLDERLQDYLANYPRSRGLSENCPKLSGNYPCGYVPIFRDELTDMNDISAPMNLAGGMPATAKRGHIPISDQMLSSSCSALQLTIQGADLQEARTIHDQLVPICPIMMALSAASPIFHGYLTDCDSRWRVPSQGFDTRTAAERGEEPLRGDSQLFPRSRLGSANGYISACNATSNDVHFPWDEKAYQQFTAAGIDTCLAKHMARELVQDPLIIFHESLHQSESSTDHLETLLSSNWHSVRLRIPRAASDMGWRVEFRPMCAQLTDFENAAYLIFMVLLTRATLSLGLDFVMPISKVDANMDKAPSRDALKQQKFFFRAEPYADAEERILCEMDVDTIINGGVTAEGINFRGLIPLLKEYLSILPEQSNGFRPMVEGYLNFISRRASGRVKTTAQWIRDFVSKHPDYKRDSVITERISYDLVHLCNEISGGKVAAQHLSSTT